MSISFNDIRSLQEIHTKIEKTSAVSFLNKCYEIIREKVKSNGLVFYAIKENNIESTIIIPEVLKDSLSMNYFKTDEVYYSFYSLKLSELKASNFFKQIKPNIFCLHYDKNFEYKFPFVFDYAYFLPTIFEQKIIGYLAIFCKASLENDIALIEYIADEWNLFVLLKGIFFNNKKLKNEIEKTFNRFDNIILIVRYPNKVIYYNEEFEKTYFKLKEFDYYKDTDFIQYLVTNELKIKTYKELDITTIYPKEAKYEILQKIKEVYESNNNLYFYLYFPINLGDNIYPAETYLKGIEFLGEKTLLFQIRFLRGIKTIEKNIKSYLQHFEEQLKLYSTLFHCMMNDLKNQITNTMLLASLVKEQNDFEINKSYVYILKLNLNDLIRKINTYLSYLLSFNQLKIGEDVSFSINDILENIYYSFSAKFSLKGLNFVCEYLEEEKNVFLKGDYFNLTNIINGLLNYISETATFGKVELNFSFKNLENDKCETYITISYYSDIEPFINLNSNEPFDIIELLNSNLSLYRYIDLILAFNLAKYFGFLLNFVKSDLLKTFVIKKIFEKSTISASEIEKSKFNELEFTDKGTGIKLLVITDDFFFEHILREIFYKYDFFVTFAKDKVSILNELNNKYHIVLIEQFIYNLKPIEILEYIRENLEEPYNNIPVIVMTNDCSTENVSYIKKLGFNDILLKPFNKTILLSIIFKHIGLTKKMFIEKEKRVLEDLIFKSVSEQFFSFDLIKVLCDNDKRKIMDFVNNLIDQINYNINCAEAFISENNYSSLLIAINKLISLYNMLYMKRNIVIAKNIINLIKNNEDINKIRVEFSRLRQMNSFILELLKDNLNKL